MLITDMGVSQLGEPSSITAALDRFFNCAQLEYFRYNLCTLTILLMTYFNAVINAALVILYIVDET